MNLPSDRPPSAVRRFAVAAALAFALVRLPWLCVASAQRTANAAPGVARVFAEDADARIARATGLSSAVLAAIRGAMPADGRLVLYSPYGGQQFELDAADPRGEPSRQVRTMFERAKNLLYPTPRDVHFARDPAELLAKVKGQAGRTLVVDGTQAPVELAVGGRYTLVHSETIAPGGLLRVWKFEAEQ